jgi:hypothetical protein
MNPPPPSYINSVQDFSHVVPLGTARESKVLEFKKDLHGFAAEAMEARRKGQLEFCRDVSAMANTIGGCIIVGVSEGGSGGSNTSVARAIHALENVPARVQWMNEAIANYLVPHTFARTMVPLSIDGAAIVVVNVPPSLHLVSIWQEDSGVVQCYRRTDHGKVAMNPDDIERHLMDGSRAARLEFARVQPLAKGNLIELVPGTFEWDRHKGVFHPTSLRVQFGLIGESQFDLLFPDMQGKTVAIPYTMVRAAWLTADNRMGLMLSVRLVWRGDGFRMEPLP